MSPGQARNSGSAIHSRLARRQAARRLAWVVSLPIALLLASAPLSATSISAQQPEPTPDPALRLATPVMPSNPSEADIGRLLYWYHCMPCHGDRGQGLTDEWRSAWVEDHQDCWARGCHAGRPGDEGFTIPRTVPAVIGSPESLAGFTNAASLADYLHENHPPQRPGALGTEDCRALAAFLLEANGLFIPTPPTGAPASTWTLVTLTVCVLVFAGMWLSIRFDA